MPLVQELHWLKMRQLIEYKLAVLVYCSLNGLAPGLEKIMIFLNKKIIFFKNLNQNLI